MQEVFLDIYRKADQWEPLARHLTRSLPLLKDDKIAREFAREASTLYLTRLGSPAKAIPALETALALEPSDKELRSALAIGQRGQAENALHYYAQAMFNIRREQGRLAEVEGAVRGFIELYPAIPAWRAARGARSETTGKFSPPARASIRATSCSWARPSPCRWRSSAPATSSPTWISSTCTRRSPPRCSRW